MAIVVISLAAGWPLMLATIASEDEDGFDALSRSFAYVNQRPGRYAAAAVVGWGLGILGLCLVGVFARTTVHMAHWALAFSAPNGLLETLFQGQTASLAAQVHRFWLSVVDLVAHGWVYSYFWTAVVIVYLLLRQDVDGTPWHAIAPPERHAFEFDAGPAAEGVPSGGLHAAPDSASSANSLTPSAAPGAPTLS
jgi:hypothetical protein